MATDFALATQALGSGLNLVGGLLGSEQSAQRAEMNQALLQREAEIARQQAQLSREARERRQDEILGATRAGFASRGVDLRGTPTEVLADQAATLERRETFQEFLEDQQVQTRRFKASRAEDRASATRTAGLLEAGTTLATGLSSLSNQGAFSEGGIFDLF